MRNLYFLLGLLMCAAVGRAQSFNVDLSINSDPSIGGGVPSDAFGAAANQPGRWNYVDVIGDAPRLYDLGGIQRNVSISIASSSGNFFGGGFLNLSNSGDYARLLNDATHVGGQWNSWTFHGLQNGTYRVITYAVEYSSQPSRAEVHVSNSHTSNPQVVQGVMPGNQFVLGVTHSIHFSEVTIGDLEIKVFKGPAPNAPMVNGFQLSIVPEPSMIVFLSVAATGYLARRRSHQRKAPG